MTWERIKAEWEADPEIMAAYHGAYPFEAEAVAFVRLRVDLRLMPDQLAQRLGVTLQTIRRAESGKHRPSRGLIRRVEALAP